MVMQRKNYFHVAAFKATLPLASAFSVCSEAAGYIIYQTTSLLPSVVQEIKQKILILLRLSAECSKKAVLSGHVGIVLSVL